MKGMPCILLTIGLGFAAAGSAQAQMSTPKASAPGKDPIELCEKLAGTERDICLRRARENAAGTIAPGIGGTPGTGSGGLLAPDADAKSDQHKRGNTPPGASRGGDAPASGAIADPAGVTRR